MAFGKWIGGFLGFIHTGSVLGALAGFAIGAWFDAIGEKQTDGGFEEVDSAAGQRQAEGQRNSFLFSLMVLSAHIIQADGRIMHSEMEFVRQFLRRSFGETAVSQGEGILLRLFELRKQNGESAWNSQISQACLEMRAGMPTEHRLQLVAYLAELIKADGHVAEAELASLRQVAALLGLAGSVVDQMFALGSQSLDDAYRVLGIAPSASDEEVRRAYKKMVRENHPDRVAALGEDVKRAATEKLQEINNAKDRIFKARGL